MDAAISDAIADLVLRAIPIVEKGSEGKVKRVWSYTRSASGAMSGEQKEAPDIQPGIMELFFTQRDEFNELKNQLSSFDVPWLDAMWDLGPLGSRRLQLEGLITSLMQFLWEDHGNFSFDSDTARRQVKEMLDKLEGSLRIRIKCLAPLEGFSVEGSGDLDIELPGFRGCKCRLKNLTEEEMTRLYGQVSFTFPAPIISSYALDYEFDYDIKVKDPTASEGEWDGWLEELRENLKLLRRSFTLLKSGRFINSTCHIYTLDSYPFGGQGTRYRFGGNNQMGSYSFITEDEESLKKLTVKLNRSLFPGLDIAISRLVDSESRHSNTDAIIDSVIGLEALLLSGSRADSLSFKFALNYALLASNDSDARKNEYSFARGLYSLRSGLVHGENITNFKINGTKLSLASIVPIGQSMLRLMIKRMLEIDPSGDSTKFWNRHWEDIYFGVSPNQDTAS